MMIPTDLYPPILLVEDNPVDVDLTLRAFARRKLVNPVRVARDGEEALAWIARWQAGEPTPAVILLDLKLPRVDGLTVLRALKTPPDLHRIPVVILSTSARRSRHQGRLWPRRQFLHRQAGRFRQVRGCGAADRAVLVRDQRTAEVSRMRVLYIEDCADDADLARRALARAAPQIEIEVASTLGDGLARLIGGTPFDVLLTDLSLPDGSGLEGLAWVRECRLPLAVVILTGSGDQEAAVSALKAGADDYLVKRDDYHDRFARTLETALARFRDGVSSALARCVCSMSSKGPFDADRMRRHLRPARALSSPDRRRGTRGTRCGGYHSVRTR